jgi:hypothetical protein
MIACVIFVRYTCPDVGFNTLKQMAAMLSSRFNKIVVEVVKKKRTLPHKNSACSAVGG